MKQYMQICSSLSFFFLILLSFAIFTFAQEVEDHEEFSYVEGSQTGPENWGNIKEEWVTCKIGRLQSPINLPFLPSQSAPNSEKIYTSYTSGRAILKNSGHDIAAEWTDKNSNIKINGKEYVLQEGHYHHPAEHTINGIRYPLELHLVHESVDNKIAVIAQPYFYAQPDPFLSKIEPQLRRFINEPTTKEIELGVIDPPQMSMNYRLNHYYRYNGSLTTPPCDEGVIWTVNKTPKSVARYQVQLLRDAIYDNATNNARPLQDRNGRPIKLYFDIFQKNQ